MKLPCGCKANEAKWLELCPEHKREHDELHAKATAEHAAKRAAYLQKRCTCGSGLADGLCVNCWPT